MAFSRKALKARALQRQRRADADSYLGLLQAGAAAYRAGKALADNPHTEGEAAEIWAEGWQDQKDNG